jgi:hypothetical protein
MLPKPVIIEIPETNTRNRKLFLEDCEAVDEIRIPARKIQPTRPARVKLELTDTRPGVSEQRPSKEIESLIDNIRGQPVEAIGRGKVGAQPRRQTGPRMSVVLIQPVSHDRRRIWTS